MSTLPELITLAYTPFVDPIDALIPSFRQWWFLTILPLSVLIAMVYRGVRTRNLASYWRSTAVFSLQIILGIIGLAVASAVFVQLVLPAITPMQN